MACRHVHDHRRILEAELGAKHGRYVYELEAVLDNGQMTELQYDAHAVESLEIERDWLLAAKSGFFVICLTVRSIRKLSFISGERFILRSANAVSIPLQWVFRQQVGLRIPPSAHA